MPSDAPSQNLFPLSSAPPAGPSLTSPTLPTGDAPPPSTSVAPLATVETGKVAPTPAVRPRRRGVRIVVALVLLGLAGAGGFLLYGRLHRRAVTKAMAQHVARLQSGDPATRSTVRQAICDLAQKETSTPRLAAACALASADLIVLDGKTELIPHAKQDLQRARRRDKADPWTIASFALLSLDDVKTMSVLSTRAAFQGKDWHLMLTRALVLDRLGRPEKAIQVLKKLITSGPAHALSPLLQATRLTRLMGNLKRAQVLIAKAKGLAPKHPGVLIETALLAATKGRAPEASAITTLRKLAAPSHLWRADVDLLEAHAMAIKGRRAEAAKLAEEAVSLAKEARPEAGWAAGRWHLAPGGDVQRAHKLLKRWGPRYEAYKPIAALWRAQSLFALARPRDADRALTELNKIAARIDLQSRQRLVTLQIRIVEGLDDHQRLSALCPATLSIAEGARVVACAEALLPRGKRKPIRRWLHRIRRHQSGSATDRYLTGLLLTARGDTKGALKKLRSVRPTSSIDESRRLSALGDAYIATKSFARGLKILREALKVSAGAARPRV
ncbi:MAG: hypothetical protein KAI47_22780, partial [Deltaproteobacteria bacterium]|nr:hypothetical protein [Deltaproteobacteria bacterium]